MRERNLETMRRAFERLNSRDVEGCLDLLTPGFTINIAEMPRPKHGKEAWRQHVDVLLTAFSDVRVSVEEMVAGGDQVAVRLVVEGTQDGPFLGLPPSGRRVRYLSHEFYRFEDGLIAEEWICSDTATLLTQLGVFSQGRMVSMWLAGYRGWVGFGAGLVAAAAVGLASSRARTTQRHFAIRRTRSKP